VSKRFQPVTLFGAYAPEGVVMRRAVLMVGLAALAAAVLPLPAGGSASPARAPATAASAASGGHFTLGGRPCSLIPVPPADAAAPVAVGSCPGVRPGGMVQSEMGLCTFNFLFRAPDGQRFIGTAGHCILGNGPVAEPGKGGGERIWPQGTGPEAKDADGNRIGQFAYAVLQDPKDFALIRLDPGVEANPEMCHFGGPTGPYEGMSADPVVLEYWGNGVAVGSTVPARSAVALGIPNEDHVYATGLALPGDSGSGVITSDGLAVGVLVTTGLHGLGISENGIDFGTMGITRIGPQVARASEVLGLPLQLETAG
jgi:hypothetical protein